MGIDLHTLVDQPRAHLEPRRRSSTRGLWLALWLIVSGLGQAIAGEVVLPEYQVKALFLVNFAKYVEWPANAVHGQSFVIGIFGEDSFGAYLRQAAEGKSAGGKPIEIRKIEAQEDLSSCQIVFMGSSEKKRLAEILARIKALPSLTVGETDHFAQQGGVIGFIKREGKVRLEINLEAARQAGLQLSSKLLSVADSVTGKH
jgi:hypothetical protein